MNFFVNNFFSKCDQIRVLKKFLTENFQKAQNQHYYFISYYKEDHERSKNNYHIVICKVPKPLLLIVQSIVQETVITLENLWEGDYFLLFWKEVLTESKQLDTDDPILGIKGKRPDE